MLIICTGKGKKAKTLKSVNYFLCVSDLGYRFSLEAGESWPLL